MPAVARLDFHRTKAHRVPMPVDVLSPVKQTHAKLAVLRCTLAVTRSGRQIVILCVFADGTGSREFRGEPRHALADASHPLGWDALFISLIELRDYLMFQQGIQSFSLCFIPCRIFAMFLAITNSPANFGRIGFRPPAVQLGKI